MTGEPLVRKPSTSSGEVPPIHTVAPKFSRSSPPAWLVEMPHDGKGTRSGSAVAGGLASCGTFLGSDGKDVAGARRLPNGVVGGTTFTVTDAFALRGLMPSSRRYGWL